MRILFYNWTPFDNESIGGGVTVYIKNLIESLNRNYLDVEIYFLSSGRDYDEHNRTVRIEEVKNNGNYKCHSFTLINSPVFAPAYLNIFNIKSVFECRELKEIFDDFLTEYGSFDAVHFQNLEGLSFDVLDCKEKHKNTKFIYSLHNYYPFCPIATFWKSTDECCECRDTGKTCIGCIGLKAPNEKLFRKLSMRRELETDFSEQKKELFSKISSELDRKYLPEESKALSFEQQRDFESLFSSYRKDFVYKINRYVDTVIAVSRRVGEIALCCGVDREKLIVQYIGTRQAEHQLAHCMNVPKKDEPFTIIFMGYQRKDKGFFFFIDVLNALEERISKKVKVILAARGSQATEAQWNLNKDKFASVIYQNGYTRDEISLLLSKAHLGLVPVLWEDNLPQVAIEMACNGVPVLCSDRGGAKELSSNHFFAFEAGNVKQCVEKITMLVEKPELLTRYFNSYQNLPTMLSHTTDLLKIYGYEKSE